MEKHDQFTDEEFERQFRFALIHPSFVTHKAHLRLAWIHIKNYGLEVAIVNVCEQIKNYAKQVGKASKYNESLTRAAVRAVYHYMLRSVSTTFDDFFSEFPQLQTNFKELIGYYHAFDVFTDPQTAED